MLAHTYAPHLKSASLPFRPYSRPRFHSAIPVAEVRLFLALGLIGARRECLPRRARIYSPTTRIVH